MIITGIDSRNYHMFSPALEHMHTLSSDYLLGAVLDDTAVGVLACRLADYCLVITAIYTAPGHRHLGCATSMINELVSYGYEQGLDGILISYHLCDETKDLFNILQKSGFEVLSKKSDILRASIAELSEASYFLECSKKNPAPDLAGDGMIVTLGELSSRTWNQFTDIIRKKRIDGSRGIYPYYLRRSDYDNELSMFVTGRDEKPEAALLVSVSGNELSIDYLWHDGSNRPGLSSMIDCLVGRFCDIPSNTVVTVHAANAPIAKMIESYGFTSLHKMESVQQAYYY